MRGAHIKAKPARAPEQETGSRFRAHPDSTPTPNTPKPTAWRKPRARWTNQKSIFCHVITLPPVPERRVRGSRDEKEADDLSGERVVCQRTVSLGVNGTELPNTHARQEKQKRVQNCQEEEPTGGSEVGHKRPRGKGARGETFKRRKPA